MDRDIEKAVYEACTTPPLLLRDNTSQKIKNRLNVLRKVLARNELATDVDLLLVIGESGDKKYPLKTPFTIGRGKESDLVLTAAFSSRNHCILERVENQWILKDLNSTNGVYVNDKKVNQHYLRHGDIIDIDSESMIFFSKEHSCDFS